MRDVIRWMGFVGIAIWATLLLPAAAVAGIEEHSPNPLPDWLLLELATYDTEGVDEAKKRYDDKEEGSDTSIAFDATILQEELILDEHLELKWRLALMGLEYVHVDELQGEDFLPEERDEESDALDPTTSIEGGTSTSQASNSNDESEDDDLASLDSALTLDDEDPNTFQAGCRATGSEHTSLFGLLLVGMCVLLRTGRRRQISTT